MLKTGKVAVMQHQQFEWSWHTQNITLIIQQNPEANSCYSDTLLNTKVACFFHGFA